MKKFIMTIILISIVGTAFADTSSDLIEAVYNYARSEQIEAQAVQDLIKIIMEQKKITDRFDKNDTTTIQKQAEEIVLLKNQVESLKRENGLLMLSDDARYEYLLNIREDIANGMMLFLPSGEALFDKMLQKVDSALVGESLN